MERTRCHPYSRGREYERDKMQDAAATIWNCVNSVQMLFSTMKESMLDILTPSWLSDFLTRLHISSNIETQPETCCPESGMQAVVNQTEDQLRRSEILLIQDEKSESPDDISTISDDKGQGQGHLRSLLHHKEVKANHSCTEQQYRTCGFNPEASSRVCVTRQHQMCGKMSSELKRKIEIDKENICYWKRQKTTGRQKFKHDRAAMTRINLTDMYTSNVSQELFSLQEDIVEKLHIQERPSQARAREVLTDLESRRILHALNRDHKPLFAIIPDLQFGPKAPKLKYFVRPFSHKKNKEAASDDTRTESADVLPSTSLDDTSQFKPVLPCQSMQSSTDLSTETGNKNSAPVEILFPAQSSLPLSTAAQNVGSGNSRNSTQPSISLTATESDTSLASAELHCLANSSEQFSTFKPELGIGTNLTEQSKPESLFHPDQLTSRSTADKLTAEKFLPMVTVEQESRISGSGIQQIQPMATDKSESGTSSSGFQFSAMLSKSLSVLKQDPGTSSSGFQCPAQPCKQVSAFKPDLGTSRWTRIQSPEQQSQPRPIFKPEPGTSPSGFQLPAQQYHSLSTGKTKPDTNSSGFQSTPKQSQSLPIFKQEPSTNPSGFQFPAQPLISMTLSQENTGTSRSSCDITSFKGLSSILSVGQNETSFSVNSESKESNGLTRCDSGFITSASSASSTNSAIDSCLTLSTDKTPTTVLKKEEPNQNVTQSLNSMPNFQFGHKSTPVSVSEQNSGYGFDNRNDISKQSIPTGQNYGVGASVFNSQDKTRSLDSSFNHPADNVMAQERLVSSIAIESSDKPKDGSLNFEPSDKDTVSSVDSKSASTNSVPDVVIVNKDGADIEPQSPGISSSLQEDNGLDDDMQCMKEDSRNTSATDVLSCSMLPPPMQFTTENEICKVPESKPAVDESNASILNPVIADIPPTVSDDTVKFAKMGMPGPQFRLPDKKSDNGDHMKLYDMGMEPGRKPFLDCLFAYLDEKGTPMSYMPTILKQPIDLFHLYMIVQALGGMLEIQAKKWKEICVLMNFPESASAAFTLKKNYMKFLFAFECCFDRGGIDPDLILAMENLEKNRVRTCRIRRDVQKTEEFSYQNICNGDSTVIHASEKDIKASYNEETAAPVDHVCSAALKRNLSLPNYHLKEGSRLQTNIPTMFHRNVKKEKSARRKIKRLPEIERVYIGNGVAPIFKEGTIAHANEKERSKTAVKSRSMTTLDTLGEIPNLPEPLAPPSVEHIPESLSFKQVFCDIETTSLTMYTEIVQIAAVCGEEEFDQYILPLRQFDPGSSKVTGLTCDGRNLYHHGTVVRTLDLRSALERFLGWLDQLKPCILVGHNFKSFDYPRLYKAFSKFHLINSFQQMVVGFIDSFPLFKAIYPNLKNYKQETLVAELVGETYDAHNALGDVRSLQKLFTVSDRIPRNLLCEHSFTVAWYVQYHNYKTKCNKIAESFSQIVNEKILSKTTIDKIAVSGLELKDLKQVYRKGGTKVVTEVLKSRLTLSRSTVDKLIEFLANKSSVDEYIPEL